MDGLNHRRNRGRGLLILALAALWVQLLVPAGFMAAQGQNGPALVICTGHGPLQLGGDHSGKAPKSSPDAPCVFAGHGLSGEAPMLARIAAPSTVYAAPIAGIAKTAAPGRGLSAPPPPARGPPPI